MTPSDTLTVVGLGLIAAGAGMAYLPLGIVLAGVCLVLIGLGLAGEKKRARR